MGQLQANTIELAQAGHIQHTSSPTPKHIAILYLVATNGVDTIDYLSCHHAHVFGPVATTCGPTCILSDTTTKDDVAA